MGLELLGPVYAWFTEGFDTPDLREAKLLLEALSCQILDAMSQLLVTWLWYTGKRKPLRAFDIPTELQNDVLKSFDYTVGDGVVLPLSQ